MPETLKGALEQQVMTTLMARLHVAGLLVDGFAADMERTLFFAKATWSTAMADALRSAKTQGLHGAHESSQPRTPEAALRLLVSDADKDDYLDIDLHLLHALPFIRPGVTVQQLHHALTCEFTEPMGALTVPPGASRRVNAVFRDAFVFETSTNTRAAKLPKVSLGRLVEPMTGVCTAKQR